MGSLVRAAAYAPRTDGAGASAPGADEDLFTFAATAIERAIEPGPLGAAPIDLFWVGDRSAVPAEGFGPLLGVPVELRPVPSSPTGLSDALSGASTAAGPALVVAAEWPAPPATPGGGVAFFLRPGPGGEAEIPGPARSASTPIAAARAAFVAAPDGERSRWVGSWTGIPPVQTGARATAPPGPARNAVSEGAYVPRARYLESLGSRWRFEGERCDACGVVGFPTRGRCRHCGRTDRLVPTRLPRENGRIIATTWIGKGGQPTEFDPQVDATGPYGVALVEVAPQVRVTLQLTDCARGELAVGAPVDTRLRRIYSLEGEWRYGRKAVPPVPS